MQLNYYYAGLYQQYFYLTVFQLTFVFRLPLLPTFFVVSVNLRPDLLLQFQDSLRHDSQIASLNLLLTSRYDLCLLHLACQQSPFSLNYSFSVTWYVCFPPVCTISSSVQPQETLICTLTLSSLTVTHSDTVKYLLACGRAWQDVGACSSCMNPVKSSILQYPSTLLNTS